MKRRNQRGLTLIELIVAFTIMLLLAAMAVPLARYKVQRNKERAASDRIVQAELPCGRRRRPSVGSTYGPWSLTFDNRRTGRCRCAKSPKS